MRYSYIFAYSQYIIVSPNFNGKMKADDLWIVTCNGGIDLRYIEYGKGNDNVIVLLHGGGLSWWNYEDVAKLLEKDYHIILPILDGHAESDKNFTTIEDNAAEIISFIDTHFGGRVFALGGLSLGGQIALEILSQRNNICRYAIIESAQVIPSKLTYSMIKPAFGSCYGLIKQKWFSVLQFRWLKIKSDLFDCYYRDTCAISKEDMIAFLQANTLYRVKESLKDCTAQVHIFVGGKENSTMKKSAQIIHRTLPNSERHILRGMYHGEFSINNGKEYAYMIRNLK